MAAESTAPFAVETRALTRTFRQKKRAEVLVALDQVNLSIREGELFGLLGPNGAGKTTLIKILATLLLPTSGQAWVGGHDVTTGAQRIRELINMVSGGETSGYGLLTVRENLWMFSQFYGMPSAVAKPKIEELLVKLGLDDRAAAKVRTLSTGERQKMNVIRGFVTDPKIIFLDEPTLGLDVSASRVIRKFIVDWLREGNGRTVLLTTHYMMEADELCDRLAIIDRGRIIACDTPLNLKRQIRASTTFELEVTLLARKDRFRGIPGVSNYVPTDLPEEGRTRLRFILEDESPVSDILTEVHRQGSAILSLRKTEPTLEDVFIALVGRGLEG